jgi:hypothetical protein
MWLNRARELLDEHERMTTKIVRDKFHQYLPRTLVSSAQAAAIFALWSLLYRADVDPSPHALRWNAPRLIALANMFYPTLSLKPSVARALPIKHVLAMDPLKRFTIRQTKAAGNAARTILAAVQKVTPETNNA